MNQQNNGKEQDEELLEIRLNELVDQLERFEQRVIETQRFALQRKDWANGRDASQMLKLTRITHKVDAAMHEVASNLIELKWIVSHS